MRSGSVKKRAPVDAGAFGVVCRAGQMAPARTQVNAQDYFNSSDDDDDDNELPHLSKKPWFYEAEKGNANNETLATKKMAVLCLI